LVWRCGVRLQPDLRVGPPKGGPHEGGPHEGGPHDGDLAVTHPHDRSEEITAARRDSNWGDRALAALGIAIAVLLLRVPSILEGHALWPGYVVVVIAAAAGMPLFAILGGMAALLFIPAGVAPG